MYERSASIFQKRMARGIIDYGQIGFEFGPNQVLIEWPVGEVYNEFGAEQRVFSNDLLLWKLQIFSPLN